MSLEVLAGVSESLAPGRQVYSSRESSTTRLQHCQPLGPCLRQEGPA